MRLWRWRIGRWLIHFGLWIMPKGPARDVIEQHLWTAGQFMLGAIDANRKGYREGNGD